MRADVITAPDGRSKGFGIVVYANPHEAEAAIQQVCITCDWVFENACACRVKENMPSHHPEIFGRHHRHSNPDSSPHRSSMRRSSTAATWSFGTTARTAAATKTGRNSTTTAQISSRLV